jgi:hypothetical protein
MLITYLSDTDPDYKCLENHLASGDFGILGDLVHYAAHQIRSIYEPIIRKLHLHFGIESDTYLQNFDSGIILPTRFDSPFQYELVNSIIEEVKLACISVGVDTASFPLYATIPTGVVNAAAVQLPCSSKSFLVFDSQIFTYCNMFSKAFAQCLPINISESDVLTFETNFEKSISHIKSGTTIIEKFIDLLEALSKSGRASNANPYLPEPEYSSLSAKIRRGMEIFIVAHEFGHVYSGHVSQIMPRFFVVDNTLSTSPNHLQEFEADSIGLQLSLLTQKSSDTSIQIIFISVYLFFFSLDLLDRWNYLISNGSDNGYLQTDSETHPRHSARQQNLISTFTEIVQSKQAQKEIKVLTFNLSAIIEALWVEIKTRYLNDKNSTAVP